MSIMGGPGGPGMASGQLMSQRIPFVTDESREEFEQLEKTFGINSSNFAYHNQMAGRHIFDPIGFSVRLNGRMTRLPGCEGRTPDGAFEEFKSAIVHYTMNGSHLYIGIGTKQMLEFAINAELDRSCLTVRRLGEPVAVRLKPEGSALNPR